MKLGGCYLSSENVKMLLVYCWVNVADGGAILKRHWLNESCFFGIYISKFSVLLFCLQGPRATAVRALADNGTR